MNNTIQSLYFVSPGGNDQFPGTEEQPFCTLQKARDAIRAISRDMREDVTVFMRGGTYHLQETLEFDHRDSGGNGCDIVYRAYSGENPVLSGGQMVSGWMRVKESAVDNLWMAPVDGIPYSRHLFVNGVPAVRAKGAIRASNRWEVLNDPNMEFDTLLETVANLQEGEKKVYQGYRATAKYLEMANWKNQSEIEFVYDVGWTHSILPVESIATIENGESVIIKMKMPAFRDAQMKGGVHIGTPNYVQNAFELLNEPGEWYFDRTAKKIYYLPRPGEDLETAECIVPFLEQIMTLKGCVESPIKHIRFEGITFAHTTFLRPTELGQAEIQANFIKNPAIDLHHTAEMKQPSAIVLDAAQSIAFERCAFVKLGSGGLDIQNGARGIVVRGCRIANIAASGIQVGDVHYMDAHPDDERKVVKDVRICNNIITNIGTEYKGSIGVFVGYAQYISIDHNEITQAPYSGISIGWGWGIWDQGGRPDPWAQDLPKFDEPTVARNNRIECNHIHRVMLTQNDGGGIYTLSRMPGTVIRGNVVHDNGHWSGRDDTAEAGVKDPVAIKAHGWPGGIYLDEGSADIEVCGNIVYNVEQCYFYNVGSLDPAMQETIRFHDNWLRIRPEDSDYPHAQAGQAGLEPAYRDLLQEEGPEVKL